MVDYNVLCIASKFAMKICGLDSIGGRTYEDIAHDLWFKLYSADKLGSDYKFSSLVSIAKHYIQDLTFRSLSWSCTDRMFDSFDTFDEVNEVWDIAADVYDSKSSVDKATIGRVVDMIGRYPHEMCHDGFYELCDHIVGG